MRRRIPRTALCLLGLVLLTACSTPAAPQTTPAPTTPPAAAAAQPTAAAQPATAQSTSAAGGIDDKAVADFYRGKTVRVVIGFGAGGVVDVYSRTIAAHMGSHIPGNPTVIVENRGGAGSLTAANAVYKSEPKDGTVVGAFTLGVVLLQAVGASNIEFDASKYQWLGAAFSDNSTCLARTSQVPQGIQDLIGPSGKELATGSLGAGTATYQTPAALNATLGAHFKLVPGYATLAEARLAFDRGEIDAYCPLYSAVVALDHERLEGASPPARVIVITGDRVPDSPLVKGAPRALDLTQTDEQKALLRALATQDAFFPPYAMAPEAPQDRVLALRRAFAETLADPATRADADKANLLLDARGGDEIADAIKQMLSLPPAILDKLRPLVV
jgi:tripartite-type tricarboxylate transporter receptor subunit TctC